METKKCTKQQEQQTTQKQNKNPQISISLACPTLAVGERLDISGIGKKSTEFSPAS